MELAQRLSDEEVRAFAGEILARDEFARWRSPGQEWIVAISEWVGDFTSWMDRIYVGSPTLYWLILGGLAALALLLLAHIVWSVRSALAAPQELPQRPRIPEPVPVAKQAEALARDGRFLEAAHRLLLASIQLLVERGTIELSRHDANRTLRERLAASSLSSEQRSEFLRLLDELETRWFRDRISDPHLYRSWGSFHARLLMELAR